MAAFGEDRAESAQERNGGAAVADPAPVDSGPGVEDWGPRLLKAARRLTEIFGGAVALPLLATDHQVLEIGRSLLHRQAAGGKTRLALLKLLESAIAAAGSPRAAGVCVRTDCRPFPRILLVGPPGSASPARVARGRGAAEAAAEPEPGRLPRLTPNAKRKHGRMHSDRDDGGERPASPRWKRARSNWRTQWLKQMKLDGIELAVVCGDVPVITLDKGTDFDSNAAWLLQNAMGSHAKTESLYEVCSSGSPNEQRIVSECLQRNLATSELEVGIVKARGREEVMAVGTCGKRSMMLALVVALALRSGDGYKHCRDELEVLNLRKQFDDLVTTAKKLSTEWQATMSGDSWSEAGGG